jgi:hypothetical protein
MSIKAGLSIENVMLMIQKKHIALQIFDCSCPENWSKTEKRAPFSVATWNMI